MIQVFHDADRGAIFVSNYNAAFPSRSVVPGLQGEVITLKVFNADKMLVGAHWSEFRKRDGTPFKDVVEAFSYVSDECNRAPARMPTVMAVAGEYIKAGAPVALSRADRTMRMARADTYSLSFVVGLAAVDVEPGFSARGVRTYVTQTDWAKVSGAETLLVGQTYFLGLEGGISPEPARLSGGCNVRVGNAVAPDTLAFVQADPILL